MRRDLIARRIVDLLVPACSAASRRLKVVMYPVERVGPRCARLGCKVFNRDRASGRARFPNQPYFVDHCLAPVALGPKVGSTVLMEQTLDVYLAAREALFRNPSDKAARAWWTSEGYAPPAHPAVPLATVHKARLQWLDATDTMLAESRAFLFDHGYAGLHIRAYTSRSRDAERAKRGLDPLKGRP